LGGEMEMNKVFQKHETYEPIFTDQYLSHGFRTDYLTKSDCTKNIELMGIYREYSGHRNYFLENKRGIIIKPKVISMEEKSFDFDSTYDVPKGNKIEIDGQEYIIIDKKYHLNGDIDYYIEDKYIKCGNYEELYEEVAKEVRVYLESKWKLEKEHEPKEEVEEKKSFWWYFGIR
jgi:hypothetical protein